MSDEFPSGSCADATLSQDGVVEAADRFLASLLLFGRGHTMCEFLTRTTLEPRVLWRVMRAELSMVVPRPDGERLAGRRRR
jgi:hypothetical protein